MDTVFSTGSRLINTVTGGGKFNSPQASTIVPTAGAVYTSGGQSMSETPAFPAPFLSAPAPESCSLDDMEEYGDEVPAFEHL
jgi:hypothetical protein